MKTKFDRKLLLKPKENHLPLLFQKKTWSWVVRLQVYDTNPTISNFLWYSYLHYTSCTEFKNTNTAIDYIDNLYKKNQIFEREIIIKRYNKESSVIQSIKTAFKNKDFKNNLIRFLNADRISKTLVRVFIRNNFILENDFKINNSNQYILNGVSELNPKTFEQPVTTLTHPLINTYISGENEDFTTEDFIDELEIVDVDPSEANKNNFNDIKTITVFNNVGIQINDFKNSNIDALEGVENITKSSVEVITISDMDNTVSRIFISNENGDIITEVILDEVMGTNGEASEIINNEILDIENTKAVKTDTILINNQDTSAINSNRSDIIELTSITGIDANFLNDVPTSVLDLNVSNDMGDITNATINNEMFMKDVFTPDLSTLKVIEIASVVNNNKIVIKDVVTSLKSNKDDGIEIKLKISIDVNLLNNLPTLEPKSVVSENIKVIKNEVLINDVDTPVVDINIENETGKTFKEHSKKSFYPGLINTEEQLEKDAKQIKIRKGTFLRTYFIIWEMSNINHKEYLKNFKTNSEFENAFRLMMKEKYNVNCMTSQNILKYRNFSYRDTMDDIKMSNKLINQLHPNFEQIINHPDLFKDEYIKEAKSIITYYPKTRRAKKKDLILSNAL